MNKGERIKLGAYASKICRYLEIPLTQIQMFI